MLILILCPPSFATAIVAISTRNGIVVGADWKIISHDINGKILPHSAIRDKIALVHDRIVMADAGLEFNNIYSFAALVHDLELHTAKDITVTKMSTTISHKLIKIFDGVDTLLKTGKVTKESVPTNVPWLTIIIAGFENGKPAMFTISLSINWEERHLEAPVITDKCTRKNLNFWAVGGNATHGIPDVLNGTVPPTREEFLVIPKILLEDEALFGDKEITIDQTLALTRGLLDLEVLSNPDKVAYPLTVFVIPPNGKITKTQYDKPYPQ